MTQKLRQELATLIIKAQKGDRYAYSQIVRQFQDLAVGYAYSILRNFSLAEEAAQEAFIEAYLNLNKLQKPAAFPGWLKKIVFKKCDRLTRKKQHPFVSLTQTGEIVSLTFSPTAVAEQRELQHTVQQAIAQLPEAEREVITLFYLGGRSQKEISTFLEIPVSTIKNRLFSARKKLKTNFNHMVEDYLYSQRPSQDNDFADKIDAIIDAACDGDEAAMQTLLKQDSSLANAKDNNIQTTPLTNASHRGYLNIVKLLISTGADVNAQEGNYSKSTALHWAATDGHLDVVEYLVSKGAKLDVKDNWHNLTPFGWATILQYPNPRRDRGTQHQEVREFLLEQGAEYDIFSAIAFNNIEQVRSLITANSKVLDRRLGFARGKLQPLHYAIQGNKTEIAELLIERGADTQAVSRWGVTPLCMAIQNENRHIIELLRSHNTPEDLSSLLVAKQWSDARSLFQTQPKLIEEKALLLHYFVKHGSIEATAWLLDRGVDLEIATMYLLDDFVANLTPLQGAVEAKQIEIARLLIDRGADIDRKTIGELEITALHDAAAMGSLDLIRLLVEHGADLNAKDNIKQKTPIYWAEFYEQPAAVKLLKQLAER